MEYRRLCYKLVVDMSHAWITYSFTGYNPKLGGHMMYEVPAMSTCGMMMARKLYDDLGGWPTEMGIYGGGENFINYTMAVMGKKKYIMKGGPLCHHGSNREYYWNYSDNKRNQCIAAYMYAGEEFAIKFMQHCKGDVVYLKKLAREMFPLQKKQREHIKRQTVIPIEEWVKLWL